MAQSVRLRRLLLFAILLSGCVVAAFHRQLLTATGTFLIREDRLEKCDALVVLSGEEGDGLRVQEAARLYRAGWAPRIILGGEPRVFAIHETEWSLPWALRIGLPRNVMQAVPNDARSSWAEAIP